MVKRIKFGQWSLLVHLTKTTADIDFVWHPKKNIDIDLKFMSFGTYEIERLLNNFETDLRVKYSDINNESSKNKEYVIKCENGFRLQYKIVQRMIERVIDHINFDWNIKNQLTNDVENIYVVGGNIEHQITDDITITYMYTSTNVSGLNEKSPDAKVYLNITSNTFGCIFDNPVLFSGVSKFIDDKLMEHVDYMQNNLINAIVALKTFRGEINENN